jgi:ATP-dependent DNA helicase RecG
MELLKNGKITNAAVVLFGKEPASLLPQCSIRLARFKGIDKSEFADSKIIDGNAFKIISEAMIFADRYLPVSSRFESGNIYRIDEPLFSVDALREVFANAVGHRDYAYLRNATLSFAIYDDRLEIWSPGLPPSGVTFDNIKTLHQSFPRNRLIAKVLYYNKLFETWGRGVKMVVDECLKAGHPEPEFVEKANGVCVILKSKQSIGPPKLYDLSKLPEGVRLSVRQKEILDIIQHAGKATLQEIVNQLAHTVTQRTIQRDLSVLKNFDLISMKGQRKSAVWKINEN